MSLSSSANPCYEVIKFKALTPTFPKAVPAERRGEGRALASSTPITAASPRKGGRPHQSTPAAAHWRSSWLQFSLLFSKAGFPGRFQVVTESGHG